MAAGPWLASAPPDDPTAPGAPVAGGAGVRPWWSAGRGRPETAATAVTGAPGPASGPEAPGGSGAAAPTPSGPLPYWSRRAGQRQAAAEAARTGGDLSSPVPGQGAP
ncbi:MAG TPA: hypothetical protein VFP72_10695, partial [Kineosporiaceae bacterium]|nr:hypothetical protein [Kineosporiaceae bacterium]